MTQTRKKVVLDTNVLISGLNWLGNPYRILNMVLSGELELIMSFEQYDEFCRVTSYDKFDYDIEKRYRMMSLIYDNANFVNPKQQIDAVPKDESDNMILECAVEGNADFIVTGDSDLLELKTFRGIAILKPGEFLKIMQGES
jgi:uncharacterized protein